MFLMILHKKDRRRTNMLLTVVGSLNMDLVTVTQKGLPEPGETIQGDSFGKHFGGKGANQAVSAARLAKALSPNNHTKDNNDSKSFTVEMVGALGDDEHGRNILEHLSKEEIVTTNIQQCSDISTGVAIVSVDGESGENTVIVVPGANGKVSENNLKNLKENKTDFVLCQNEIPIDITKAAFQAAKEKENVQTFWNPAPFPSNNMKEFESILPLVDILCVNETEWEAMIHHGGKALLKKIPGKVIITKGKEGSELYVKGESICTVPAHPLPKGKKVVDTTGAGDCFCGSLAYLLKMKFPIEEAMKIASEASSIAVTRKGAQESYPMVEEITLLKDYHEKKNKKMKQ